MKDIELFTRALKLEAPWRIEKIDFKKIDKREELHIHLTHDRGVKFNYGDEKCPVYDHQYRSWKHLGFFQYSCYIHCDVPRVMTAAKKVRLVSIPWAGKGSGFTLLFEALIMSLVLDGLSVKRAADRMGITDKRTFRIIDRNVSHALATQPLEKVTEMSIDETSRKKGHKYFTILTDRELKKVVGIALGKDKKAVAKALEEMELRGANREDVRNLTMDMSKSYISAANEYFQGAQIIFDRFHLQKSLNDAIDKIRREEQKHHDGLKKSRYMWLKNKSNLTKEQEQKIDILSQSYPTIGEAYRLKELYREVMNDAYYNNRLKPINDWMKIAWKSGIEHIQDFVNLLKTHWYGIKTYFKTLATNAYAENVNLKIQQIKATARGYRNSNNYMKMIYFHLGKLDLIHYPL